MESSVAEVLDKITENYEKVLKEIELPNDVIIENQEEFMNLEDTEDEMD